MDGYVFLGHRKRSIAPKQSQYVCIPVQKNHAWEQTRTRYVPTDQAANESYRKDILDDVAT